MQEAHRAIEWIDNEFAPGARAATPGTGTESSSGTSHFETVIRVLGGLLSAHHLADRSPVLLSAATEMGLRLLAGWQTPHGVPSKCVNLSTPVTAPCEDHRDPCLADAGTNALEFHALGQVWHAPFQCTAPHSSVQFRPA